MGNIQSTPQPDVTFPQNASEWTISNLSALKIFYDDRATDLSVYMSLLIKESDEIALSDIQLPAIYSFMSTRTLLAHPFVFDERTFGTEEQKTSNRNNGKTDVREALRVLNAEGTQNFQDSLPQDIRIDTFYRWKLNLKDFCTFFKALLDRWDMESQRKGRFTHLFMLFLRTCLLCPEPGDTYHETLKIQNITVGGDPNARLKAYPSQKTVAVIEVKPEHVFTVDQDYANLPINQQMQPKLLGQHGIELLLQKNTSIFKSGVAGIVCVGTKVIFTFLKIEQDHFSQIVSDGTADEAHRAIIFNTKPFDFMKNTDRKELMEILLKLAVVQSGNDL